MSDTRVSAPARQDFRPVQEVAVLDDLFRNANFLKSLERACTATLTPARVISTFQGSLRRSPELRQCNVLDVAGKVLALANVGLEPDSPLQHAHLIPFKDRVWNPATRQREERMICQVVFGYRGLLDLAFRSGLVTTVRTDVVWADEEAAGAFQHELGTSGYLKHRKLGREHKSDAMSQFNATAEFPTWAYSLVGIKGTSDVSFDLMPWTDIRRVRDGSPAYRAAEAAKRRSKENDQGPSAAWLKAPWVEHVAAMASKTVFRHHSNWIPRSVEFAAAVALDEASERGHIDLGPIVDLDTSHYAEAAVDAAGETGDPGTAFGDRREEATRPETQVTGGKAPPESSATQQTRPPAQRKSPAKRAAPAAPDEPPPGWDEQSPPSDGAPVGGAGAVPPQTPTEPAAGGSSTTRDTPPAAATSFEEWLLDYAGDVVGEQPFSDAVSFAHAALEEHDKTMPPDRAAFLEHNSGALENARQASDEAARVLGAIDATDGAEESPGVLVVPFTNAGQYLKDTKAAIGALVPANFDDWVALNRGEMAKATASTVSLVLKALVERASQIGATVPPDLGPALLQANKAPATSATPPASAPAPVTPPAHPANGAGTPDDDPAWATARNRISDMRTFRTDAELGHYVQKGEIMKAFIARLQHDGKPDVIDWMRAEYEKIRAELRART